jgi:hypothetical protein
MMFALSNKDLQARYEAMSLNINVEPKGYLSYRDSKPLFGLRLNVPSEGPKVALLAYSLVAFEGDEFCGALLWFTSWDIGTPQIERCGLKLLEQMRRGYGVTPSVENAPAQFFRTDESVDAQAFLTLPLTFGWDAYFMPHGTRYFAYARRNGSLFLVTDQEEVSQKLLAFFEKRHPVPELPSYLRSAQQTL